MNRKLKKKENPFVAPVEKESSSEGKYIPPALRKKMALENTEVSEEVLKLRKEIKGPLNKLSESNISSIVNTINELYLNNPRQRVNEELTTMVLDSVIQQGRLLDTFVYLHASLIVAIHRLQGVEFGAYFIQTLIEKFESCYKDNTKSKESSNMVSLISSVYLFQLISSKLIYDIIKTLLKDLNETNADLLLRLIRSSGNQMRSDDPNSLKEIIIEMNKSVANVPLDQFNTRTQFLIETISSLKNNKLKISNEANHQLSIRLKKFLATINNNKFSDPIQVSLDDIHSVDTRGKWWLIGSAWKGHENDGSGDSNVNEIALNDILDQADPNWMELARAQRMNTDIRRAIFVSIMSATDYIDAVTKLDKLGLKRSQERETPRVLVRCAGVEPAWNPYYGILAKKLCEQHSYRKTFQFMMWDLLKELEGSANEDDDFLGFDDDNENDDDKLKRTLNLGRFYGFLISEGSLPLHILRTVNFLTANNNVVLFMEVLFITLLDKIGKKSQVRHVGVSRGAKDMKFEDKLLIEMVLKAKEQQTLLRGIQYFLQNKVRTSDIIDGKKQRARVEWGVDAFIDIIDELFKNSDD
jgi:nucleolar MIF4G domain-containing protein 1